MRFDPEPSIQKSEHENVYGVLLCNLGTPDAPTPDAVRRYLREFLSDPRVVELPRWLWMLILHGFILRFRPSKSAKKYASIWTKDGSPLLIWTLKQASKLELSLSESGHKILVRAAMRYGKPSIESQIKVLKAAGADRILVLPCYPQYSSTTTASLFDAIYGWAKKTRVIPEFRFVNRYHDDPAYIRALASGVREQWSQHGRAQKLLMSFHGVPARTRQLGDPYYDECMKTAQLLANELGLDQQAWQVTFQSRLGRAEWLQPYTEPTLIALARSGVQSVDVICPGFTSDCLETLEEIALEGKQAFLSAGGQTFNYIKCLNDKEYWIACLNKLVYSHMAGWFDTGDNTHPSK